MKKTQLGLNTDQQVDLGYAMAALTGGTTEWAHLVEKMGQNDLLRSSVLPKVEGNEKQLYEQMGIVFGEPVDSIFLKATLPPGWSLRPTEDPRWNYVVDKNGKNRISVFFKPEFYDRYAKMTPVSRYSVQTVYPEKQGDRRFVVLKDSGKTVFVFGSIQPSDFGSSTEDAIQHQACKMMHRYLPEYRNVLSYWDGNPHLSLPIVQNWNHRVISVASKKKLSQKRNWGKWKKRK